MPKILRIFLLAALLALPAFAQDEEAVEQPAAEADGVEAEDVDDADVDDADLDEQTYEEDEDDFVPTQEIPSDEPIAFPSNI